MSRTATTPPPAAAEPVRRPYPRGFTIIDNRIITDFCPQIGIAGLALYAVLSKYADNVTRQCYPSIRTLSRQLGISRPTVHKVTAVLEEVGLVRVERGHATRGKRPVNIYTLLPIPDGPLAVPSMVHQVAYDGHNGPQDGQPKVNDVDRVGQGGLPELYSINYTQLNKRESERGSESEPSAHAPAPPSHLDHVAVKAYRDACRRTPNATQRAAISETVTDLSRWEEVIRQWVLAGFRKQNVAGMLDWYNQGIPQRGGNNPWSAAGKLLGFQGNRPGEWQPSTPKETPEETARLDAEWEALGREARERARALQEAANQTADG
jgi:hypothetical protein